METTLFPVTALPACVTNCGSLYDVNGACVPPATTTAAESVYASCFCNNPKLAPFKTGTTGVCDNACAATTDLGSIQSWFTSFCNNIAAVAVDTTTVTSSTSLAQAGSSNNGGGGGTWIDTHYQWVIFLVIMIVGIVGIWVGACIWRRRYLRKKDRGYALGTNLARTTAFGPGVPNASSAGSVHASQPGAFQPTPVSGAGVYGEKPQKAKKKWLVRERT